MEWTEDILPAVEELSAKLGPNTRLIPLRRFDVGYTEAEVYVVDVLSLSGFSGMAVLKIQLASSTAGKLTDEAGRHRTAVKDSPERFTSEHLPHVIASHELEAGWGLLTSIAGGSLHVVFPAFQLSDQQLTQAYGCISRGLLDDWNPDYTVSETAVPVWDAVKEWLDHSRLNRVLELGETVPGMDPEKEAFSLEGMWLPNPMWFVARDGAQLTEPSTLLFFGREQEIKRAIKDAHFVILILSTNAVDRRGFFQKEIRLALDTLQTVPSGQIYLIPVRLDNCKIPEPLGFIHCIDLTPDWENGISRVCAAIEFQNHIRGLIAEREREKSRETVAKASILLVNDEPAAMNTIVDQWRLAGFKIDYAFDVDQAIRKIQENKPTVVVSDMSHFVYGERVTDRAAFEILEWARRSRTELKLIITCAEITPERRRGASELGAIGICNNVLDLEKLLMQAGNLSDIDVHPRMSLWNE